MLRWATICRVWSSTPPNSWVIETYVVLDSCFTHPSLHWGTLVSCLWNLTINVEDTYKPIKAFIIKVSHSQDACISIYIYNVCDWHSQVWLRLQLDHCSTAHYSRIQTALHSARWAYLLISAASAFLQVPSLSPDGLIYTFSRQFSHCHVRGEIILLHICQLHIRLDDICAIYTITVPHGLMVRAVDFWIHWLMRTRFKPRSWNSIGVSCR